jgi:hypothetical protein
MIPASKNRQALEALHRVMCHVRKMALENRPQAEIARILDWAELLPVHLAHENDRSAEFETALGGVVDADERTRWILKAYLGPAPSPHAVRLVVSTGTVH